MPAASSFIPYPIFIKFSATGRESWAPKYKGKKVFPEQIFHLPIALRIGLVCYCVYFHRRSKYLLKINNVSIWQQSVFILLIAFATLLINSFQRYDNKKKKKRKRERERNVAWVLCNRLMHARFVYHIARNFNNNNNSLSRECIYFSFHISHFTFHISHYRFINKLSINSHDIARNIARKSGKISQRSK